MLSLSLKSRLFDLRGVHLLILVISKTYGSVHLLILVISKSASGLFCLCLRIFPPSLPVLVLCCLFMLLNSYSFKNDTVYTNRVSLQLSLWRTDSFFEFNLFPIYFILRLWSYPLYLMLSCVIGWRTVETCISFMGLYLIRMVRSVETKRMRGTKRKNKTGRK